MSWQEEIKKEKYQGPPTEMSRYAHVLTPTRLKSLHRHFTELEKKLKEQTDLDNLPRGGVIDYHMESMREILDKIDDELESQAKYGFEDGRRVDERFIGNYTIKPRKDDAIE